MRTANRVILGKTIETLRCGRVQWITLNAPEARNAFNQIMIAELTQAFRELPTDTAAVVLTGKGKVFSAGADLGWMKQMAAYSREENLADSQRLYDLFNSMFECPLPIVGRINGDAMGGGVGLVAGCDIAFAVERANFAFSEVKLGLVPAVISPFVMRKIGTAHAHRYFLTGERFGTGDARRIGLLQGVAATIEELDKSVEEVVTQLGQNSPQAVRECKHLLRGVTAAHGQDNPSAVRDLVCRTIAAIRVSEEGQEGLQSFLEKRAPQWARK